MWYWSRSWEPPLPLFLVSNGVICLQNYLRFKMPRNRGSWNGNWIYWGINVVVQDGGCDSIIWIRLCYSRRSYWQLLWYNSSEWRIRYWNWRIDLNWNRWFITCLSDNAKYDVIYNFSNFIVYDFVCTPISDSSIAIMEELVDGMGEILD